jgi:membrane associated rhomboid family serine protease
MTPASVGFQCPECVREGHKSVRQPKRFTGARVGFRALPVTFSLIGVNVAVWAAIFFSGSWSWTLARVVGLSLGGECAGYPSNEFIDEQTCRSYQSGGAPVFWAGVDDGAVWQLLTSAFTHVGILHLAVNMFSLYMLGSFLEPIVGRLRFLVFYLISGLAGSVLIVWASAPYGSTVGASGAIFGLLGMLVVLFLRAGQSLMPLLPVLVVNAAITFSGNGISWQGHVGGFLGGLVVAWVFTEFRADRKAPLQWAALGGFTLALLAVIGVRILLF